LVIAQAAALSCSPEDTAPPANAGGAGAAGSQSGSGGGSPTAGTMNGGDSGHGGASGAPSGTAENAGAAGSTEQAGAPGSSGGTSSAGAGGATGTAGEAGAAGETGAAGEAGAGPAPECAEGEIETNCDGEKVTHCKSGRIVTESCTPCQALYCAVPGTCCADVGAYVLDAPSAGGGVRPDLLVSFGPDPDSPNFPSPLAHVNFDAPNQEAVIWFALSTPDPSWVNGFIINAGASGMWIDKPFVAVETDHGGCELQISYVEDVSGMYNQFDTVTPPQHCWGESIQGQPIKRVSYRVRSLDPGPVVLGVQYL